MVLEAKSREQQEEQEQTFRGEGRKPVFESVFGV